MLAKLPRILIAAASSGSGKTTVVSGLLRALSRRRTAVMAYKSGPDYIDPMFHRAVLDTPCRNLDLYFSTEDQVRTLVAESATAACAQLVVMEGVMGFYDGLGGNTEIASAYHVARTTKTPVILVVDGRGTSLTLCATIKGLMEFRPESNVAGVIINRCSKMLFSSLAPLIQKECGIPALGYVPNKEKFALESRHLGLITAGEVGDLQARIDAVADALEEGIDFDALLAIAQGAPELAYEPLAVEPVTDQKPVIAVAYDEAFCFYYEESFDILHRLGADLRFFSPLEDEELPEEACALYLGGGYPELHAAELAANKAMRASVVKAREKGMPLFAECGGFLYCKETLDDMEGNTYPMTGILPGGARYTGKLSRFGYVELNAQAAGMGVEKGSVMRAHEFHYYDSDDNGAAFYAVKSTGKNWDCGVVEERLVAGFPHLYLPSCPDFAAGFVKAAAAYKQEQGL